MIFDGLAAIMSITLCIIALAVGLVAYGELAREQGRTRCLVFLTLLFGASLAASMTTSLLVLLITWEIIALTIWQLFGFSWQRPWRVRSGARAYLFLRTGDIGLYVAAAVGFGVAGTFEISQVAAELPSPWLEVAAVGLIVSAAAKSAQLPFSLWMRDGFGDENNPMGHVSAPLAASLLVVAGGYLLVRCYEILAALEWALPVLTWVGVATALLMGLVALVQRDLRLMLASSSASQKGFILMAVGLGALPGAVAFIVAHGFFKALLFISAAICQQRGGTTKLALLARVRPQVSIPGFGLLFGVGALALAGVPPLSGWVVKDKVLAAALDVDPLMYGLSLMAAIITALYASKMAWLMWLPPPSEDRDVLPAPVEEQTKNRLSLAAMVVLAAATLVMSTLVISPVHTQWALLVGGPAALAPPLWQLVLMGLTALAALFVVRRWHGTDSLEPWSLGIAPRWFVDWLERWLDLDRLLLAFASVGNKMIRTLKNLDDRSAFVEFGRRTTLGVSAMLSSLDRKLVFDLPRQTALATLAIARWTTKRAEVVVESAVEMLTRAVREGGHNARRPQTGLLHQYYAQATVVLAMLIFFLWLTK